MSNYLLDTQQVKDKIQASSLSPSLKGAIASLLGDAAQTTLEKVSAAPNTTLEISGENDFVLATAGGKYTATSDTSVIIIEGDAPTELNVSIEDPSAELVVVGGTNDDKIILTDASVLASADGEVGVATIDGRDGDDLIAGSIGNDRLSGNDGNDTISGGAGNDFIDGGQGNDTLYGNDGDDTIYGDEGNDVINGGQGNDTLYGNADDDAIYGGDGNDVIEGGFGNDTLHGDDGDDAIYGDEGNDVIKGGKGKDRLSGNDGNDTISGDEGDDFIDGGQGNDTLHGNDGDDTIYGDEGNDVIDGGKGNDILYGNVDDDTLSGGEGDDIVEGGFGNDTLYGNEGTDTVSGDEGNDVIDGGKGTDTLYGNDDDDTLSGGEDDDFIDGGDGTDTLLLTGRDARDYSFRFHNGNAVITHKDGGTDGTDTVANVEMIRFTGEDMRTDAVVGRLYEALLNREADHGGKQGWVQANESGLSIHDIATGFLQSAEAKLLHAEMTDVEYVNMLYTTALDRSADREGLIGWTKALENGSMDRADVLLSFANSAEKLSSEPVVEMDFNRSEAATLVRMYDSLLNRAADEGGINSYLEALENGASLHDVALSFVNSAEAEETYGSLTNIEFIDKLYSSAFDRTPDAEGLTVWTKALQNGSMDRADVLLSFADSTEKIELTGVVNTTLHHDV
jgi:Ca2+-binding RTX toxin-like protein